MVVALHDRERKDRKEASFGAAQALMHHCATLLVRVCAPPVSSQPESAGHTHGGDGAPVSVALLLASHCGTAARVARLRRCLASVAGQRGGALGAVFLSWSSAPDVRDEAAAAVAAAAAAGLPGFVAVEQPHALRQFEHLAALLPRAAAALGEEAWLTFSDDDDVLHPCRAAAYAEAARLATPRGAEAVVAGWVARPVADEPQVAGAADVDGLVAAGRVVRVPAEGAPAEGGGAWEEWWCYGVRLRVLSEFLARACPPPLRASAYADLGFYWYLKHAVPTARFTPHRSGFGANFLHYYDNPTAPRVAAEAGRERRALSAGVSAHAADERAAAHLAAHLSAEQLAALPPPAAPAAPPPLLLLAAQTRSCVEMYAACFAGAPGAPPAAAWLSLGLLSTADQLAALGWPAPLLAATAEHLALPLLREVAESFGVTLG